MEVVTTKKFKKSFDKLQQPTKTKVKKVMEFLKQDKFSHPGLNTKKMQGVDHWEARIDRSYLLTFEKTKDMIILRTVGPHDEGLGKK